MVVSFVFVSISMAQEANTASTKKECVPTKECAAKHGMTLEQCKALCQKKCTKSASAEASTNTASTVAVGMPAYGKQKGM